MPRDDVVEDECAARVKRIEIDEWVGSTWEL